MAMKKNACEGSGKDDHSDAVSANMVAKKEKEQDTQKARR